MTRPLIGVTTSEVRPAERAQQAAESEPPGQQEMALGLKYLQAVEDAGGLPVVLPPLEPAALEPMIRRLSGLCLSGGPDLDPTAYEARPHPKLGPVWPDLDRFELELAKTADARGLPILAICRGLQALNVARGGTLHQHLPDAVGEQIHHRQTEPGGEPTHDVRVAPGSRLADVLGVTELEVNSFHHQAIDRLGRGLVAVAWAPDGTIEGIEAEDVDFLLGVQWHAECLVKRPPEERLFAALVKAAGEYEERLESSRAA